MATETETLPRWRRIGGIPRGLQPVVLPVAFVLLIVLVWEGVVRAGFWPEYAVPSPVSVFHRIWDGLRNGSIVIGVRLSLKRMAIGYGLSLVLGIALGMIVARFQVAERTIGTLVAGLQVLPSITWLPLALIWFGLNDRAIIFVVVMGSLLAVTQATADGVKNTPRIYLRAAQTLGAGGLTLYFRIILPASLPYIITGMKMGWSFAWRSLMAAELLFVTPGLGHLLAMGREFNDVAQVMAVMIVIVVIGLVVDRLVFSRMEQYLRTRWGLTGLRGDKA